MEPLVNDAARPEGSSKLSIQADWRYLLGFEVVFACWPCGHQERDIIGIFIEDKNLITGDDAVGEGLFVDLMGEGCADLEIRFALSASLVPKWTFWPR